MAKKSRKNTRTKARSSPVTRDESGMAFSTGVLVLVFLLGLGLGGFAGYQTALVLESNSVTTTDAYGRTPDDPHYRHNHP